MNISGQFFNSAGGQQRPSTDELRQQMREKLPLLEAIISDSELKDAFLEDYEDLAPLWAEDLLIENAHIDFTELETFLKGISRERIEDTVKSFLSSASKALLTSALEEQSPESTQKQAEILTLVKDMIPDRSWALIADILNLGGSSIEEALERGDYYLQRLDQTDLERLEKALVNEFPVDAVAGGIFKIFQTISAEKLNNYFKLFACLFTKQDARLLLDVASPVAIDLARAFAEGADLLPQTRTPDFRAFSRAVKLLATVAQEVTPLVQLLPALTEERNAVKAYARKMDGLIADMARQKPDFGTASPAPQ